MMRPNRVFLLIFVFLFPWLSNAQERDSTEHRLTALLVSTGVVYAGSLIYLSNQWYSDYEKQTWQFFNDSREWKQMDKVGHVYGAYQLQSLSYESFRWAGLNHGKSLLWSGVSSFAFMATIEVLDGFSTGYGASATDLVANTLGIGIFTAQQGLWKEVRLHPKFSFRRSGYAEIRPELLGSNLAEEILKDYNGQTYWLSADLYSFIGGKFPKWLNISIGYGAEAMVYADDGQNMENGYDNYRQWYLGIDFDVTHIRSKSKFVNTALYFVNMIRIPAPALEFSDGKTKWHWLY
jgi:hypothetical protein